MFSKREEHFDPGVLTGRIQNLDFRTELPLLVILLCLFFVSNKTPFCFATNILHGTTNILFLKDFCFSSINKSSSEFQHIFSAYIIPKGTNWH
jgi:hypothetical protein